MEVGAIGFAVGLSLTIANSPLMGILLQRFNNSIAHHVYNFRLSTLIGLQKTTSGNYWSVGTNCQMNLATYQGWSDSTGSSASTAFVYNNGVWTSILPSATASSAVCRIGK